MTLAKLVLSNPPTQRKVKLRVKRFIEILVYRKTEFVFYFANTCCVFFDILQNVHIPVAQIFLEMILPERCQTL